MKHLIANSPLEQFELVTLLPINLWGLNFSLTNSSLFLFISALSFLMIFNLSITQSTLVPTRWQLIAELSYGATASIVEDNIGQKGERYFPLVFIILMLVLSCNLLGIVPYSFTVTSHIAFTFALAFSVFIGINLIGIRVHGAHLLAIFLPKGAPAAIIPLLVIIEFISYIVKVFTLAIRLFANITSGHTLLKIIAGFGWTMLNIGGFVTILSLVPLLVLLILIGLELGIAILQAYVFALLVCIYLNDVMDIH
nr:ATP synthase F0 subunit 6 [Cavernulicola chilensis]